MLTIAINDIKQLLCDNMILLIAGLITLALVSSSIWLQFGILFIL